MILNRRHALGLGAGALAMPFVARAQGAGSVNVYNWADYIGETTLTDFTAATGIEITYDNYDSAEAAEAKLMAGQSGYDVVVTAGRNLPRFATAGILSPLDKSKLPNMKNLDPAIMAIMAQLDPGNALSIPYMWGTTGITINRRLVEELVPNAPVDTMDILFDPAIAEKLAECGINMLRFLILKRVMNKYCIIPLRTG